MAEQPQGAVLPNAAARVRAAVACRECGYNLFTLAESGLCPECGTPVAHSLRGYLLRYASPQWLRRVARGGWLLVVAIGLAVLAGLAVGVWGFYMAMKVNPAGGASPAFNPRAISLASLVAFAPVAVLSVVALWLFTAPNPADTTAGTDPAARRWLRVSIWLYAASTLGGWFIALIPGGFLSPNTRGSLTALNMPVGIAIFTLMGTLGLRYIGQLMARVPRPGLVRFAGICFWGALICGALVTLFDVVMAGTMAQNFVAFNAASTAPASASMPFGAAGAPAAATGIGMMFAACPGCVGMGFFAASFVLLIMASAALSGAAREARQNAAGPEFGIGSPT